MDTPSNQIISERLHEAADLLEQQGANPFRVRAYRNAAATVASLDRDIAQLASEGGMEALVALPHIGQGIATAIMEILSTGRWSQIERLRGALDPEQLFQTVPGIGPGLARRIHEGLGIDTLEALELGAHDGRLEAVPGVGPRRAAAIRATLEGMLSRRRLRRVQHADGPPVDLLLEVDRQYREKAEAGGLPTLAPKRFNPQQQAWLPVLHTRRGPWQFTALYSNTARAHELGRTRDWVVIYFYDDHQREGQYTVVTETRGPMVGARVVRGRERECRQHYQQDRARQGAVEAGSEHGR